MAILNLQKRSRELGRIRTGHKAEGGRPEKLAKFRLTSASRPLLEKVAALYGGTVREWTPSGGTSQWEAYTEVDRIPIIVPPQPVSQWYETWKRSGCVHRCDGETNFLTGELCDPEDPDHTAAKPTTRLKVILRDVEGVGVWRLESHGWNAAVELPDAADFLAQAGGYIEGHLALEERVTHSIVDGKPQTNRFMVPIIEIGVTPAELLAGKGRIVPALEGGPVPRIEPERPALNAAQGNGGAPPLPTVDDIAAARDTATLSEIYAVLDAAGAITAEINAAGEKRYAELTAPVAPSWAATQPQQPDADGAVDADVVDDGDAVWNAILAEAGKRGITLPALQDDFRTQMGGLIANDATSGELQLYLDKLLAADKEPVAS